MSIRLTVQITVQAGKGTAFEAFMGRTCRRVKAEDAGCEIYDLYKRVEGGTQYVLLESWSTQEQLDAHGQSAAMGEISEGVSEFMAGRPAVYRADD